MSLSTLHHSSLQLRRKFIGTGMQEWHQSRVMDLFEGESAEFYKNVIIR